MPCESLAVCDKRCIHADRSSPVASNSAAGKRVPQDDFMLVVRRPLVDKIDAGLLGVERFEHRTAWRRQPPRERTRFNPSAGPA